MRKRDGRSIEKMQFPNDLDRNIVFFNQGAYGKRENFSNRG